MSSQVFSTTTTRSMLSSRTIRIFRRLHQLFNVQDTGIAINASKLTDPEQFDCKNRFDTVRFLECVIIPALFITVVMSFTKYRLHLLPNLWRGRPGLMIPMSTLEGRTSRLSYAAAFGLISALCVDMIFSDLLLEGFFYPYFYVMSYITTGLLYSVTLYPIFACLSSRTILGYILGSLYVWGLFGISLVVLLDCNFTIMLRLFEVSNSLPFLVCLLFLCLSFPYKLVGAIRYHVTRRLPDKSADYMSAHVNNLLSSTKKPLSPEGFIDKGLVRFIHKHIYTPIPGYRYSSWRLSIFFVSAIILYTIYNEFLMLFVPALVVMDKAFTTQGGWTTDDDLVDAWKAYVNGTMDSQEIYIIIAYHCRALLVTVIVTFTVVLIVACIGLINSMSRYKLHLLAMYRGKFSAVKRRQKPSNSHMLASHVKFFGYSTTYSALGFLIQLFLAITLASAVTTYIFMPLSLNTMPYGYKLFLKVIPTFAIMLLIVLMQRLLSKFIFLQDFGKSMALNNRRMFFIFSYYMLGVNMVAGVGSFFWRLCRWLVYSFLEVPRLDVDYNPRRHHGKDPGYNIYLNTLYVEYSLSHPVLIVFSRILQQFYHQRRIYHHVLKQTGQPETPKQSKDLGRRKRAFNRWFLAITLHNNPSLRKHPIPTTCSAQSTSTVSTEPAIQDNVPHQKNAPQTGVKNAALSMQYLSVPDEARSAAQHQLHGAGNRLTQTHTNTKMSYNTSPM